MEHTIDSHPDPDVHALQTVDALLMRARSELRPALLRAEQRQRDREAKRCKAAGKRPQSECAPLLEQERAA